VFNAIAKRQRFLFGVSGSEYPLAMDEEASAVVVAAPKFIYAHRLRVPAPTSRKRHLFSSTKLAVAVVVMVPLPLLKQSSSSDGKNDIENDEALFESASCCRNILNAMSLQVHSDPVHSDSERVF
jgi:hypothetical protein